MLILLAVGVVLSITSCGKKQETEKNNDAKTASGETFESKPRDDGDYAVIYSYDDGRSIVTNQNIQYKNDKIDFIDLGEALKDGLTTIEKYIEIANFTPNSTYEDGAKLYDNGLLYLIECNTASGIKDIVIGDSENLYDEHC